MTQEAARSLRLSIIVPTLDDDAALARLLERLGTAPARAEEILVVDGAASATTAAICRARGAVWIASRANRGAQLAQGAARARGDVLWFLHADADPDPRALLAVRAAIAGGAAGGYLRFRFAAGPTLTRRILEACIAWRCRVGMVYGDQGLFAARADYERSPGFAVQPLFEEVPLVRALRRSRAFVELPLEIRVSTRRWERDGYWRRTLLNRLLALGAACGVAPARLARWYRRGDATARDKGPRRSARDSRGDRRTMR